MAFVHYVHWEVNLADKDSMERKVFLLPIELVARLKAYQTESGIVSEVEAVRRLLDTALQMRDNVETILEKLEAKFEDEKDLRVLATDVLTRHPLVKSVNFGDAECSFELKDGFWGKTTWNGELYIKEPGANYDDWSDYKRIRSNRRLKQKTSANGWDARSSADMDDEIPF